MALQPIHRRYGYGAARLPIGAPPESMRLSECAQSRSDHERIFALLPGLVCAGLAVLLAVAASFDLGDRTAELAAVEPTTIEIEPWESPPRVADLPPPAEIAPREVEARPEPVIAELTPASGETPQSEPTSHELDVALLAMAPTQAIPIPDARDSHAIVETASPAQHRPQPARTSTRIPVERLARSLPTAASLVVPSSDADVEMARSAPSRSQRPGSGSDAAAPSDVTGWTPERSRSDFLAALDESGSSAAGPGAQPSGGAARPQVAAAAAMAVGREVRDRVRQQALRDGWHEVPLDELPACSPPERQDELKKRILLATAAQRARECSHPDGQYRFLETRNLNAFLMWSRTHPESASAQQPARDVCDVLMRALVCLEGVSNKDLGKDLGVK